MVAGTTAEGDRRGDKASMDYAPYKDALLRKVFDLRPSSYQHRRCRRRQLSVTHVV